MSDHHQTSAEPLRVLVICTGNICRSPLAEQLLRQAANRAGLGGELVFDSAGTHAEVGRDVHPQSVSSAASRQIVIESSIAKQLTPDLIDGADLVLTATANHRGDVVRSLVQANRKTFTLKEFVRVVEFLNGDVSHLEDIDRENIERASTIRDRVALASKYRGFTPPRVESDDVVDPWGLGQETYDAVTDELIAITARTIELLGGN